MTSAAVTVAVRPARVVVVTVTVPAPAPKPAAKAVPRRHVIVVVHTAAPKPVRRHSKPKPVPQAKKPAPAHPRTTPSLYERTTSPTILREQGCRAGTARTSGLVVLDFGRPAYAHHRYGTITFADRFASNTAITWALKSYARGYAECLPKFAKAKITLVRGTSNYHLKAVPSTYQAGRWWARETAVLAQYLERHGFDSRVESAAGDDAEPAWDRTFHRTFDFFRGFGTDGRGYLLYNYGSLDGGPGQIWKVRQAYYVAGGMLYARAVPEIYTRTMAEEWAMLSRLGAERYGKPVQFAGLMTQHTKHCRSGCYTPAQAHTALVGELAKSPKTRVRMLASVTNIGAPAPPQSIRAR